MTWKEIKAQMECLGIKDDSEIHYIDIHFPMDKDDEESRNIEFKMYIHSESEIFGFGICTQETWK